MNPTSGKIRECLEKFPDTHIWIDSCGKDDLTYGMQIGTVGATTNPVIVGNVLKQELPQWEDRIREIIAQNPTANEDDVAWILIEEMGKRGARLLTQIYDESNGKVGRISMQTNIKNYRNSAKMLEQARYFGGLAENIMVKMPVSEAGLVAFEEATYHGVSINATVSFSVAQAVAVAEAVERGLSRRKAEGLSNDHLTPVCTIMIGRVDDWLKKVVSETNAAIDPQSLEWGGIAVFKKAYGIFKLRGYRTRLLTAAYRNQYHWSALIGGPVSMTITKSYLEKFDQSDVVIENTLEQPVNERYLKDLRTLKDFRRAYDEDGMSPCEFSHFGPFCVCLEGFFKGYDELVCLIRSFMIGQPMQ